MITIYTGYDLTPCEGCINFPEARLHPSKQIAYAEGLIFDEDVASGAKHLSIQTHSDLIVRRILRAVLEQGIQARVYWSPDSSKPPILLKIDRQGRIADWPEGFMDADVRESRNLINTMYSASRPEPFEGD